LRHRRGSPGGVPRTDPHRGHHPGAGVLARGGLRQEAGPADAARPGPGDQRLRPRRQGHLHHRQARRHPAPVNQEKHASRKDTGSQGKVEGKLFPAPRRPRRCPSSPMSRIKGVLDRLKAQGRKGLVPYITAGDPHPQHTVALMHALVRGGADIIELGVPFSDPMADGPVIQLACERALAHGTSLWQVIAMVAEFRKTDSSTPVVLMGYLNPIEARGFSAFAQQAKAAGVDGVLVVDLAVEEAPEIAPLFRAAGLDCIFLLAPTSSGARIAAVAQQASGYLYYVSLKGVTGAASLDVESVAAKL